MTPKYIKHNYEGHQENIFWLLMLVTIYTWINIYQENIAGIIKSEKNNYYIRLFKSSLVHARAAIDLKS